MPNSQHRLRGRGLPTSKSSPLVDPTTSFATRALAFARSGCAGSQKGTRPSLPGALTDDDFNLRFLLHVRVGALCQLAPPRPLGAYSPPGAREVEAEEERSTPGRSSAHGGFRAVCGPVAGTAALSGASRADPSPRGRAASAPTDPCLCVGRENPGTSRGSDRRWARGKAEAFEDRADRRGGLDRGDNPCRRPAAGTRQDIDGEDGPVAGGAVPESPAPVLRAERRSRRRGDRSGSGAAGAPRAAPSRQGRVAGGGDGVRLSGRCLSVADV